MICYNCIHSNLGHENNFIYCETFEMVMKSRTKPCVYSCISQNRIKPGVYNFHKTNHKRKHIVEKVSVYEDKGILKVQFVKNLTGVKITDMPVGTMLVRRS